jgi:uncharacterized RDD family membrane protein YckC
VTDVVHPSEPAGEQPVDDDVGDELPPPPPAERRHPVASAWVRGGELLLEVVLMACTFAFGWVGWWIVAWADGQSPAKVVLHLHVVDARHGRVASFGRMALREAVGKGLPGVVAVVGIYYGQVWLVAVSVLYALIGAAVAAADPRHRMLWDLIAGTVVLDGDPPPFAVPAPPVDIPPVDIPPVDVPPVVEAELTPAEADTSLS